MDQNEGLLRQEDQLAYISSTISHATVLVSDPLELVIVNDVDATLAVTRTNPGVPPSACEVT